MKRALIAAAVVLALAPIAASAQENQYQDPVVTVLRQCQDQNATPSQLMACAKALLVNVLPGQYHDTMLHVLNQEILNVINPDYDSSVDTPPAQDDNNGAGDDNN